MLTEHKADSGTADLARKRGIFSEATLYHWKAKFGGVNVPETKRLEAFDDDNAEAAGRADGDAGALRGALKRMVGPPRQARRSCAPADQDGVVGTADLFIVGAAGG